METARPATRLPFGRLLRRFRLAAGLSQDTLAERAGVSIRTISDLERGVNRRPRGSTFRLLVDALDLTMEERAALQVAAIPHDDLVPPPTRAGMNPPPILTNLPLALTSFVGREPDVETVRQLLGKTRLLTLTGAGGCGKTRLALEVAHWAAQTDAYPDGVWLVALASLSDEAVLIPAAATVLGVRERTGEQLLETLTTFLRPKQMLFLLDNCEHLVAACAQLADALLRVCPRLTILATSREALNIGGERPWPVPSLRLADPRRVHTVEAAAACEAVRLFVQRAQVVRPGFTLTEQNRGLAEQVCRRLDGIPLAIELAAARLSSLSLEQVSARLDDRFRLLTGGSRTALPRQQTLRATLDWSHDLLGEGERLLLRRLSVFAAGWVLEAAEAICAGEGIVADEVVDLLAGLVAKSLVVLVEGRTGPRYWLLETMRQYGREKLCTTGEEPVMRDRHLAWYLALAEQAAQRIGAAEREIWLERLEVELENLRNALRWSSIEVGRHEPGLRLATALEDFWYVRGYASEGRRWLEELLTRAGSAAVVLRARALGVLALLTYYKADYLQAMAYFESAHALYSSEGNLTGATWMINYQGLIALHLDDYQRATTLLECVLPRHREQGDRHGVGWALGYLAIIRRRQGDDARAVALFEESLAEFRELGDKFGIGSQLANLANVVRTQGDDRQAERLYHESLLERRTLLDKPGFADCFEGIAMTIAEEQPERAVCLLGAAYAIREAIGVPIDVVMRPDKDHTVATVQAMLEERTFAAAWAEGRALPLEAVIALALEEPAPLET